VVIVSGHDLLSRAIACVLVGPQINSTDTSFGIQEHKHKLLKNMHKHIALIWAKSEKDETVRVRECYEVFCSTFRAFMRMYPGPDDLRIMPLDAVDVNSVLCEQAVSHLSARLQNTVDEEGEVVVSKSMPSVCKGMRYFDIIKAYAEDLHAASF
jgi:hypothetical protein